MKQKLIRLISYSTLFSGAAAFIGAGIANAQIGSSAPNALVDNATNLNTGLFCPIINAMFWVLISLAIIMVMWAAYNYLIAGDDTEKVHRATKTLTFAAVAVVVALLAKGFPDIVSSIFPSFGNGAWTVC
jgi:uncharacterized protein YacL